jgi:hypothetical protein
LSGNEKSEILYAEKRDLNIVKSLLKCFKINNNQSVANVIQLTTKNAENKYERVIEVKSNSGVNNIINFSKKKFANL